VVAVSVVGMVRVAVWVAAVAASGGGGGSMQGEAMVVTSTLW
jgi:hypothetical protein